MHTQRYKKLTNGFPFILVPEMYKSSSHSTTFPTFGVVSLFHFSHSTVCVLVSHGDSNYHLPDD